jgi:hypothetical protein
MPTSPSSPQRNQKEDAPKDTVVDLTFSSDDEVQILNVHRSDDDDDSSYTSSQGDRSGGNTPVGSVNGDSLFRLFDSEDVALSNNDPQRKVELPNRKSSAKSDTVTIDRKARLHDASKSPFFSTEAPSTPVHRRKKLILEEKVDDTEEPPHPWKLPEGSLWMPTSQISTPKRPSRPLFHRGKWTKSKPVIAATSSTTHAKNKVEPFKPKVPVATGEAETHKTPPPPKGLLEVETDGVVITVTSKPDTQNVEKQLIGMDSLVDVEATRPPNNKPRRIRTRTSWSNDKKKKNQQKERLNYEPAVDSDQSDNDEGVATRLPEDPLFHQCEILTPLEMEFLWLGEESMYCLGVSSFDLKFIWHYASAALRVKLRQLSPGDPIPQIIRKDDALVEKRFAFLREEVRSEMNAGYRRPRMKYVIAILRIQRLLDAQQQRNESDSPTYNKSKSKSSAGKFPRLKFPPINPEG